MKKALLIILVNLFLSGCSTVNFSANYYSPPAGYESEVKKLWEEVIAETPLKYSYSMNIVSDNQCKDAKGIPQIENSLVRLPDNFIKYVYQNYYNDRRKVFACVIVHELMHKEYGLPSSPPKVHFQVDQKAIGLTGKRPSYSPCDYYKALFVLRNYWFSRKGLGGHAFNVGWNVVQAASLAYIGQAHFVDWFATDLDRRLSLISRDYKVKGRSCFERTGADIYARK